MTYDTVVPVIVDSCLFSYFLSKKLSVVLDCFLSEKMLGCQFYSLDDILFLGFFILLTFLSSWLGFFISWLFYLLAFLSLGFLFSWLFNLLFSKENYQRYQINSPQSKMSKIQGLLFQKIFQQGMSMNDAENFLTLHSNIMCCRPTILCRMYAGKREKIIINSNSPHTYWIFFINKQGNIST